MPLIIITGVPSSGKTTRAKELKQFFENQSKEVYIVSEYEELVKAGFNKNQLYADSNKEKHIRGLLKSEAFRLITPTNVVILDGLNYIKGYRYELYCGTKSNRSTQCTLHTEINREQAWGFNENRSDNEEKYTRDNFDALVMRYEDPDKKNRWDSPLFTVFPENDLDTTAIYSSIFKRSPPKPNLSTQNPPTSSTNYLYDLDRITNSITNEIIQSKQKGLSEIDNLPGCKESFTFDVAEVSIQQLTSLRRQYITYSKMHTPDIDKVPELYVQYLKASLKQ